MLSSVAPSNAQRNSLSSSGGSSMFYPGNYNITSNYRWGRWVRVLRCSYNQYPSGSFCCRWVWVWRYWWSFISLWRQLSFMFAIINIILYIIQNHTENWNSVRVWDQQPFGIYSLLTSIRELLYWKLILSSIVWTVRGRTRLPNLDFLSVRYTLLLCRSRVQWVRLMLMSLIFTWLNFSRPTRISFPSSSLIVKVVELTSLDLNPLRIICGPLGVICLINGSFLV